MITDPAEIAIIANAVQKNVRDPGRSRLHFERIISDFFNPNCFKEKKIIDLGPGQYDLGELVSEFGCLTVGIDRDPAVVELGHYKGFTVIKSDLKNIADLTELRGEFDGVFCKFSIDCFWFSEAEQFQYIAALDALLTDTGWAWISPWNGGRSPEDRDSRMTILAAQKSAFEQLGYKCFELSIKEAKYYGVHGITDNRVIFVKNLNDITLSGRLMPREMLARLKRTVLQILKRMKS